MNALRWAIAALLVLFAGGYVFLFVIASGFRKSFGSSGAGILWLIAPLAIALFLAGWIAPWRKSAAKVLTPAALDYPVLLVNEAQIAEICLNADELTLRPENTDHVIEQRFHLVDATGRRYRISNFRSVEKRPSTISRVFSATVYSVHRFRVAFDLVFERSLSRDEVLAQLRDREWEMPAKALSAPTFGELFVAYRADRYREYGNGRDQMPDLAAPVPASR